MTRDLISREDAMMEARPEYLSPEQIGHEEYNKGWSDAIKAYWDNLNNLPAKTQDRPKGEWIDEDGTYYANCSKCGYQMDTHVERGYFRYCPNCGSDMRGEKE